MDKKQLIAKLNWFYSLELNQVDLYYSQSKALNSSRESFYFERIAYIEQQHVDNIGQKIKDLGGTPSKIGDVVSPIIGSFAGTVISFSGLKNILIANILIEQKAMKDYQDLINSVQNSFPDDEGLIKLLKSNYIDEDLHTAWFTTQLNKKS